MTIAEQFPEVHWIWKGGISFVYEVHPRIVVKVPKNEEFEREQFRKEVQLYKLFAQHAPCPSIVQCFLPTENGIFLEYMRDVSLCTRIQYNSIRDQQTGVVIGVIKLEPLPLRKQWMHDLTQAVAFLESLNLAHGDLRPENILLDRDRLKLSDFDCTAEIGSYFEACMAPYGRVLGYDEQDPGGSGLLGPRTEQFALGSIFYFMNYGFEVYDDRLLTEDPREHGCKVVDLLQHMEFPSLHGDCPSIDEIVSKCWHNKYATIAELAADTKYLLTGSKARDAEPERFVDTGRWPIMGQLFGRLRQYLKFWWDMFLHRISQSIKSGHARIDNSDDPAAYNNHNGSMEDDKAKKLICLDLEQRGLLDLLATGEPEHLGFTFEWLRYSEDQDDS